MVNIIKDIVNKLDGFSSDNQGYAVTAFAVKGNDFEVCVKPYLKSEELSGLEEWEHLIEMCNRLYSVYAKEGGHYKVTEAVSRDGSWTLVLNSVEEKPDET